MRITSFIGKRLNSETKFRIRLIYDFFFDKERYRRLKDDLKKNCSYGEKNENLHFYVIRRNPKATGLLACYLCALGHLIDNDKKIASGKLTPVMDMMTNYYDMIHNSEKEVMKNNAWEYYFKQFSSYSMNDVLVSKHVTLSFAHEVDSALQFFHGNEITRQTINMYLPIHNKYFKLNDSLAQMFEKERKSLLGEKRVLGTNVREGYIVLANGRDDKNSKYSGERINGHPIQPNIDELCELLEAKMREWNCDYIFAECQTTFVESKLRMKFGDKFLCTSRERFDVSDLSYDSWIAAVKKSNVIKERVKNNIDYLKSIYMLSKCTSIFAGKCSGTVVASFWNNNNYENMVIINKGVY